jgi:hypothetical protein
MGGSVQTVYTLKRMGYLDTDRLSIHPLDSTDPASLNRILEAIGAPGGRRLAETLRHTMMIGVSMGMTSEEPITHLAWFDSLLKEHNVSDPGSHIQVMTLPDSYLDQFARPRQCARVPIQLDAENHTPGRMSAPATRVFIRPLALLSAALGAPGAVRTVLERGQSLYRLHHAMSDTERRAATEQDAFVRLAAWLSLRADRGQGAPKLLVVLPPGWEGFAPWLEQLVEESLGKDGKGFLIFYGQSTAAQYGNDCAVLRIHVDHFPPTPAGPEGLPAIDLQVPATTGGPLPREARGLGGLSGLMLSFKKTVAVYGYLQHIIYAGQPAVEAYKKYARDLREAAGPVTLDSGAAGDTGGRDRLPAAGGLTLDYSSLSKRGLLSGNALRAAVQRLGGRDTDAAGVLAAILLCAREAGSLRYLDLTWNGELSAPVRAALDGARERLANAALSIPAKVRTGPSDYHSTEQGETDGPPELVSLRLVAETHEPVAAGQYDDKFLLAQARGTWQAMEDAGRWIVFMILPDTSEASVRALGQFLDGVTSRLKGV